MHALIFDFGNVVSFFDYLRACEKLGKPLGLTAEDFRRRIVDRGFAGLLAQFESGRIASEEFAERVMVLGGLALPYREFALAWQDIFWLNEPVARLIERLKGAGYPLLLGSNTNVLHYIHYRQQFAATLDLFDHHILSHEVGHLKPHREFYEACVAAAGLPTAACVFIDDMPENVEGARQAGLTGVHYVDTPTLIADLRRLGVEIARDP
jgi:glucose-1-phosphatase